MLVECRGQALAICRISVAELRRVAPPAFYLLMVASLLLADGLLPVLAVKLRTEAALYSGGLTARSSNGNTFIGGDWPAAAAAASSSAHAMATGNVRTQSNHKRTRVKTYVPTLAGNADGKSKHHYTVVSNSHDVAAMPSPQSYVSSATPTHVTSHRSTPPASSSSSSSSSSTHPLVCSSNGTKDIFFLPLKDPNIFSRGSISDAPPSVNKKCIVLTNDTVPDFCAGRRQDMRLQFCSAYKVSDVYDTKTSNCSEYLLGIIDKDKWVEKHFEGFRDIIKRYDCRTKYSVKWDCYRCKSKKVNYVYRQLCLEIRIISGLQCENGMKKESHDAKICGILGSAMYNDQFADCNPDNDLYHKD
ncbi:hypothetical protein Btru_033978 [Bulinus truncatus]|nr:hypothetical protein Btru_033978 [Bulinus truncatus]